MARAPLLVSQGQYVQRVLAAQPRSLSIFSAVLSEISDHSLMQVASFVGDRHFPAEGNMHYVFCGHADEAQCQQLSQRIAPAIFVHITDNDNILSARFYHFGEPVLRCGSGYLAVAHTLFECYSSRSIITIQTRVGEVALTRDGDGYGFRLPKLPYTSAAYYSQSPLSRCFPWQTIINQPMKDIHFIGGANDYVHIRVQSEKQLRECRVNTQRLVRYSRRSLILTAKSVQPLCDYVLRYFAPRYGQSEDAATGSANAVVAGYWQKALGRRSLRARQLSEAGGVFSIRDRGLQQQVMGRAKRITEDNTGIKNRQ